MCMAVCLHVCLCTTCMPAAHRNQKVSDPCNQNYTQLGAAMWVLRIELGSPGRAASALKRLSYFSSLPVSTFFFFLSFLFVYFLGFLYTFWISVSYKISLSNASLMSFLSSLDAHAHIFNEAQFVVFVYILVLF